MTRMTPRELDRNRSLLAITLGLAGALAAAPGGAADFRGFDWGASQSEVRAGETLPLHHDLEGEIAYWDFQVAGVVSGLVYRFVDDRLVRAHYIVRESPSGPDEEDRIYAAYRGHLLEVHGEPRAEDWLDAEGDPVPEGDRTLAAVRSGRVRLVTSWESDRTRVQLVRSSRNGRFGLRAFHESTSAPPRG